MELIKRPRRLRYSKILREAVRETRIYASSLIYPVFVKEGLNIREEIPSMPGQYRWSPDTLPALYE
ncbi:MAG: porphobilinogen synthase, partial [Spirochaetaceae bacterium]|nr:porphobilinogen synthase [Spirochaetaceae bacterium]